MVPSNTTSYLPLGQGEEAIYNLNVESVEDPPQQQGVVSITIIIFHVFVRMCFNSILLLLLYIIIIVYILCVYTFCRVSPFSQPYHHHQRGDRD